MVLFNLCHWTFLFLCENTFKPLCYATLMENCVSQSVLFFIFWQWGIKLYNYMSIHINQFDIIVSYEPSQWGNCQVAIFRFFTLIINTNWINYNLKQWMTLYLWMTVDDTYNQISSLSCRYRGEWHIHNNEYNSQFIQLFYCKAHCKRPFINIIPGICSDLHEYDKLFIDDPLP